MAATPISLSAASAVSDPTSTSSASRQVSSPRSSEPARSHAVATNWSASISFPPQLVPRTPGSRGRSDEVRPTVDVDVGPGDVAVAARRQVHRDAGDLLREPGATEVAGLVE